MTKVPADFLRRAKGEIDTSCKVFVVFMAPLDFQRCIETASLGPRVSKVDVFTFVKDDRGYRECTKGEITLSAR